MFHFKVQPDDGDPFEVVGGTRDVLVWEKSGRDRSVAKLLGDLKVTDMYAIAHIAAKRQQLWNGSLTEFEQSVDIVSDILAAAEEEPDPTRPGPSAGPSSPSPSTPESRPRSGRSKKSG